MSDRPFALCHMHDLAVGGCRGFDPDSTGQDTVFAVRDTHGTRVFRNLCPHEDAPLAWRKDNYMAPGGEAIMCFAHGARFDKLSGECTSGPCVGAYLERLPTEIDSEDQLVLLAVKEASPEPSARFDVRVAQTRLETERIRTIRLESLDGERLPAFTPGAHIEVWPTESIKRTYSLINDPATRDHYLLGVALSESSNGGSRAMHALYPGAILQIGMPHNNFPLELSAPKHILIAGGIGVTPLLSMAAALHDRGANFELHYVTRSRQSTAFINLINQSGFCENVRYYFDEDGPAQNLGNSGLLTSPWQGAHLYVSGPDGFVTATLERASGIWPNAALHNERFGNA